MEKHISVVGALQIGLSIVGMIMGAMIFVVLFATGIIADDRDAFLILSTIGVLVGGAFFTLCLLGIVGGIGILKHKNWARILVLILSAIDLINFPIGTALAVYSFWVLIQDETVRLFTEPR
ncbi:MAG: hypothetical protein OEM41_09315 [Ignavibacteria bacterium]|nr:hypothetical protein [Ignavibacteria bacterium]